MTEISSPPRIRSTYTGGTIATVPLSARTAGTTLQVGDFFAAIRRYAQTHHTTVLELIAEYALDDLPISVGQMIVSYLEEHRPKVQPGDVKPHPFFSSGRSDISERMEEIIYGPDQDE